MNRRSVIMNSGQVYTIAVEEPAPTAAHIWGVVRARLIDDVTGEPVNVPVRIEVRERGLTPRIAQDGIIGLVGVPLNIFPYLDAQGYTLHFTIYAEGYLPVAIPTLAIPGIIAQNASFPQAFTPLDLGDLRLVR
jgi:hypothetical protein